MRRSVRWATSFGRLTAIMALATISVAYSVPGGADTATGSISGVITDTSTGVGIANVCVNAYPYGGGQSVTAPSNSDGMYTISGLQPGEYSVYINPECEQSSTLTYSVQTLVGPFNVAAGETLTGVNAELSPGGSISGTVTDAATGNPLSGVCVSASVTGTGVATMQPTEANGTYSISGLLSASYSVYFLPNCSDSSPFAPLDSYAPLDLSGINVAVGEVTDNVNASLALAGAISGTITDAATGDPLSGICVDAFSTSNSNEKYFEVATTEANGSFTITGLAPGSYNVDLNTSWYWSPTESCASSPTYAPETGLGPVTVVSGETANNSDTLIAFTGTPTSVVLTPGAGATLTLTSGSANATVSVPSGALPSGTTVRLYPVTNSSPVSAQVPSDNAYLVSFVVSWSAPDGSSLIAALPITLTISDPDIVVGDEVIVPTSKGIENFGVASTNGSVSLTFTTDPTFILAKTRASALEHPISVEVGFTTRGDSLSSGAKISLIAFSKRLVKGSTVTVTGYAAGDLHLARSRAESVSNFLSKRVGNRVTIKTGTSSMWNIAKVSGFRS